MKKQTSIKQIIKREGNLVPYDRDRISTAIFRARASVGKGNRALSETLSVEVENVLIANYGEGSTPSVEEIQDIVEKTLMEKGHVEIARAYILYRNERARARAARAYAFEVTDNIPYKKVYEVLCWNMDHACLSIRDLNAIIDRGRFPELVRDSERRYEKEIIQCACRILERRNEIRVIIISGPSSSGKTTTTFKLSEQLKKAGIEYKAINLDHYFFDLEKHPKDEFGDYDYEAPKSLDLELINRHLSLLLEGETIRTPHYDFKAGRRTLDVHEMRLEKNHMLLLDSLHGLYEPMTASITPSLKFKLYIETLGQFRSEEGEFLRWADNRLMRRMIRDSRLRNSQPETTLTHWHYVRRGELKYIIPFVKTADFLVNSTFPYEIPILKNHVFKFFPEAVTQYRQDPGRQDAYIRAKRIYEFLLPLMEVADDSCVPPDSLLREFIGGSCYKC